MNLVHFNLHVPLHKDVLRVKAVSAWSMIMDVAEDDYFVSYYKVLFSFSGIRNSYHEHGIAGSTVHRSSSR